MAALDATCILYKVRVRRMILNNRRRRERRFGRWSEEERVWSIELGASRPNRRRRIVA